LENIFEYVLKTNFVSEKVLQLQSWIVTVTWK